MFLFYAFYIEEGVRENDAILHLKAKGKGLILLRNYPLTIFSPGDLDKNF